MFGRDLADALVTWNRQQIGHGRYPLDHNGQETPNPCVADLLAIPVEPIAEFVADRGIDLPTRAQFRDWIAKDLADGGDGIDPELELWRAREVVDPDLAASAQTPTEPRICGVPRSVYEMLQPDAQRKVHEGLVIAPPQAPTYVARWLIRHLFTVRLRIPGQPRRAWMRTLVRVDQTWYHYSVPETGGPARWIARPDSEWLRGQLRGALARLWYLKARTAAGQTIYDKLKAWNPDTRTLKMVEDALADLLSAGTGTSARELPDAYGDQRTAYPTADRQVWVRVRNGVLDVASGKVLPDCPLWFSLTMIEADYSHQVDWADTDWMGVLTAQWPNDPGAIICLQQWFGYLLSGRNDLQKFMFVVGPKGSAKSLIADVAEALMGSSVELGLAALNSQFGLADAYDRGATFAVMADMRFGARDTSLAVSRLLAITGGDTVQIDRKYKDVVSVKLPVRLHGSANELPRLSDHSGALGSRLLILETSRVFRGTDDDDPGLKHRIVTEELGAVLRWAVDGLAQLNASGGVFAVSARAEELAEEVADEFSNVRQFVSQCCEIGAEDDYVLLAELFRVWCKWAIENKSGERMSQNAFRKALMAMHHDPIRPGQKKGTGERVVRGIMGARCDYVERDRFGGDQQKTISTGGLTAEGDPFKRKAG
ncbi:hypothetical protein KXD97_22095 [Mycobacterium sp. SMC-8]|uniref:DNA primase family protein n=1 Tax=Mycobacterium sp. SMC-8 TaxID=2857060 RepID=UPI0021B24C05|nr:phage/plasmid primase, P4 family [Mycobacterium sp. SMC-8]UXA10754.1 hypothetical protein KXD97_22095 [Mycobacterium sp. SMC-8]